MTVLDLLVDGEIVREAMLVDNSDGEEIIYKGPGLEKKIKGISSFLMARIPNLMYFTIRIPQKKYVVISLGHSKYLVLGIDQKVNSEQLVDQMTNSLKELGLEWKD